MGMTKENFFDELAESLRVTEAQLEEQYYWEMARRKQFWIDRMIEQANAQPESHWFTSDFEAWMFQQQREEVERITMQALIGSRIESKPTHCTDLDLNPLTEDANHQKRNSNSDDLFI